MKKVFTVVIGMVVLYVYTSTIVTIWHICLPLAIVLICSLVSALLKSIVITVTGEERAIKQERAQDIAALPIAIYMIYILWSANIALAITWIILEMIQMVDIILSPEA